MFSGVPEANKLLTNQPINQPTNRYVCFTICLFITGSPDLDGNRVPKGIKRTPKQTNKQTNPTRPTTKWDMSVSGTDNFETKSKLIKKPEHFKRYFNLAEAGRSPISKKFHLKICRSALRQPPRSVVVSQLPPVSTRSNTRSMENALNRGAAYGVDKSGQERRVSLPKTPPNVHIRIAISSRQLMRCKMTLRTSGQGRLYRADISASASIHCSRMFHPQLMHTKV